jgi:hypothetical protein
VATAVIHKNIKTTANSSVASARQSVHNKFIHETQYKIVRKYYKSCVKIMRALKADDSDRRTVWRKEEEIGRVRYY